MGKFIIKKIQQNKIIKIKANSVISNIEEPISIEDDKNNSKKEKKMNTEEKIEMAQGVLGTSNVKRIKKHKELIERVESTVILTEDNKQLLVD